MRKKHVAVYGNVGMERVWCKLCKCMTLVVDGERLCCDRPSPGEPTAAVRMSEPECVRHQPSKERQQQLLDEQGSCCLYCERSFGSTVVYKRRLVVLSVRWDHLIPWNYSRNNGDQNFGAACQLCNSAKSNRVFLELEEARAYVASRLRITEETGVDDLPAVPDEVPDHEGR